MIYGSQTYGPDTYANNGEGQSPNAIIDMSSLGGGGIITILLDPLSPNVNGVNVNLDAIPNSLIIIDLSSYSFKFSDAGELWKRVPQHSQANFLP